MTQSDVPDSPASAPRRVPTREVVLLPDERFFVRRVPLVRGEPGAAGAVLEQVELAIEGMAPFPLSQILLGYWTRPEADHALVFAAYLKRFGGDEIESWAGADLVTPRFASLLGAPAPAPATTWVIEAEDGSSLTLVHFDDASGVPASVVVQSLPDEAGEATRRELRSRALKQIGESRHVVDLPEPRVEPSPPGECDFTVRAGGAESVLPIEIAEQIDVRDRSELTGRRRARVRDRWLWRAVVAAAAVIVLCGVAELTMLGLKTWQQARLARIAQQAPVVNQIMTAQTLAVRIDELSTKRLRPFEMIGAVDSKRPPSIQFVRTVTNGLYSLVVSAQTTVQPDIDAYRAALAELPMTQSVEVRDLSSREGRSTFQLVVNFVPGTLAVIAEDAAATAGAVEAAGKEPSA